MQTRQFGNTDLQVSTLAFGTMSFGGDADERTAAALFARARAAGINFFDCANVYNEGNAERILGKLAKKERDKLVLTTKAYFPVGDGPDDRGAGRTHLLREIDRSLTRLDTDYIDVFFLHRFDDNVAAEETLAALHEAVRAGKIRHIGASNYAAWQVAKFIGVSALHEWPKFSCIQPMYNLLKRQAEVELLPMAAAMNLAVTPYGPLAGGLLTGKYLSEGAGRFSDNKMYQTRYEDPTYETQVRQFIDWCVREHLPPVAVAIRWAMSHPAITAPLIGARNVRQLEGALACLEIEWDEERQRAVSGITPAPPPATDRSEENTGANYAAVLRK